MEEIEDNSHSGNEHESKDNVDETQHGPRRRRLSRTQLLIVVAALLLIATSASTIGYSTLYRPYTQQLQQTAQVQARLDRQVAERATDEAILGTTATAITRATTTVRTIRQATYNTVIQQTPLLTDLLHTADTYNWDTSSGCSFSHGTYTATVTQKGFFLPCLAKRTNFSNFAYQVDIEITQGDAGGLVVRANTTNTESYLFVVDQDSTYSVYYYPGDAKQRAQTLTDGYSDAIKGGHKQKNTIGIIASGTSLDFYINHTYVTSVVDEHRNNGMIGVLANNYTSTTTVIYTRASVWKL